LFKERKETFEEHEYQFTFNHLGHFLLANLLIEPLKKAQPSRVLVVTSSMYQKEAIGLNEIALDKNGEYNPLRAYGQSKLANIWFSKEMQREMSDKMLDIKIVSVNPGARSKVPKPLKKSEVSSENQLFSDFKSFSYKTWLWYTGQSSLDMAQTPIHCALEEHEALEPGGFYSKSKRKELPGQLIKYIDMERFWNFSVDAVRLRGRQETCRGNDI
jgi:retinol dehydrogenase 12